MHAYKYTCRHTYLIEKRAHPVLVRVLRVEGQALVAAHGHNLPLRLAESGLVLQSQRRPRALADGFHGFEGRLAEAPPAARE